MVKEIRDLPYTISFIIRKRMQIDSFNELPEEKRPPDEMVWGNRQSELGKWLKDILSNKPKKVSEIVIKDNEIEG